MRSLHTVFLFLSLVLGSLPTAFAQTPPASASAPPSVWLESGLAYRPGDDALTGGSRADIFVFEGVGGRDRVLDFRNNEDKLDLSDYGWSFAEVQQRTAASGNNAVVIDVGSPGNGGSITVQGLGLSRLDASDLILVG